MLGPLLEIVTTIGINAGIEEMRLSTRRLQWQHKPTLGVTDDLAFPCHSSYLCRKELRCALDRRSRKFSSGMGASKEAHRESITIISFLSANESSSVMD